MLTLYEIGKYEGSKSTLDRILVPSEEAYKEFKDNANDLALTINYLIGNLSINKETISDIYDKLVMTTDHIYLIIRSKEEYSKEVIFDFKPEIIFRKHQL